MPATDLPAPLAAERVHVDPDDLPIDRGAYVLVLDLQETVRLDISTLSDVVLQPGRYLYVGSARGPGGIRARAGRHLRRTKRRHWHIDRLTAIAAPAGAIALPGGQECVTVQALLGEPGVTAPIPGFGSSDCRLCDAHLLSYVRR